MPAEAQSEALSSGWRGARHPGPALRADWQTLDRTRKRTPGYAGGERTFDDGGTGMLGQANVCSLVVVSCAAVAAPTSSSLELLAQHLDEDCEDRGEQRGGPVAHP